MSVRNGACKGIVVIAALALISACTKGGNKGSDPSQVLEAYVNAAMSAKSAKDKEKLKELSMGEAREALEKMSDKEFEQQFVENRLQKSASIKTKDLRQEAGGDISLVYELSYNESSADAKPTMMTVKKIAYMGKDEKGEWKIKATKNVKSLIEKTEPLLIPLENATAAPESPKK